MSLPSNTMFSTFWLGGRHDICVVGDVAQTILFFCGCLTALPSRLCTGAQGAHVVQLVRDYRSTPQIVSAANTLMKGEHSSVLKGAVKLVSQRDNGVPVDYQSYADDNDEAVGIARQIRKLHDDGISYSSIAILYRTNGQSENFEAQLSEAASPSLSILGYAFLSVKRSAARCFY